MARARALPTIVAMAVLLVVGLIGIGMSRTGFAADDQKGILVDLISRALSTPSSRVTIGSIEGALSSNATVHDLAIQDRDGVWLKLDRARIVWNRLALFSRRLEVDDLDLGTLTVLRKPIPAEHPVAGEQQPLLPDLPVKVDIKQFALSEMILGQPILGEPTRFSAGGFATLGAPAEGLVVHLDGQRLDRPASLTVRLGLVPENQKLSLDVALDEPAGGILSHLASIPGSPPVKLHLGGDGTLDAFVAHLAFDAGPGIAANGATTLTREGPARRLALDLSADVGGLLPSAAAPVFAGTTTLTGDVVFGDDTAVTIPGLALVAAAARLDIAGAIDAAHVADIKVTAANRPTMASSTAVGEARIGRLAFDARVTGALASPTIASTLLVEDARAPAGAVAHLDARFSAVPTGAVTDTATQLNLSADAEATGLKLANPSLDQAVGDRATFALQGTTTLKGALHFDRLDLVSPTVSMRFTGEADAAELDGHLDVAAPDLARFGAVAGFALKGGMTIGADLEGTPRSNRFSARVDGSGTRFATGIASLDGLFGGSATLKGAVRLDPDGGLGFTDLVLRGPHATARIDGAATPALADLTAQVTVPSLAAADGRLSGSGEIAAHVTGTLDRPDASARLTITDAAMLGRPVPHLTIAATATGLRTAPDAHLSLEGTVDAKPARGALHLARTPDGAVALDGVDLDIGSVQVQGSLTLDAAQLADGRLSVRAGNLDDLSPLLLQKLSGRLDADVGLSHAGPRQDAKVKADGQAIAAFGVAIDRVSADLTATDITHRPSLAGQVAVDAARIGGETITRVRLDAKPAGAASDITLGASARGFDLAARLKVVPATPLRIELSRLDAVRGRDRIALAAPTIVTLRDGVAELTAVAVNLAGGRLTLDGRAGSTLDLKVGARAVPLSVARLASPSLDLDGTLDGDATLRGPAGTPSGDYKVRVTNLSTPPSRSAGLPPLIVVASGRLDGARATLDATVAAAQAGTIRVTGSAPLHQGSVDLAVRGTLDAALANRSIGAAGRRVTGSVAIDGRVGGTLDKPQVSGTAALANGTVQDAVIGLRLDAVQARLVARGDEVTIEGASATTRNGGTLTAGGRVKLDAGAGFPGALTVRGSRVQLVQSSLATGVVNLDMTVAGPLARAPRLGGRVDVVSLDVPVPDRLPGSLRPLPGTRHVRPTPTAAARLAIDAKAKAGRPGPAFDAALDIAIGVPGSIHVYGRGLDATLGGGLRLTGSLARPRPVGAFTLVQGRLRVLTANLDFTRASLTFAGDLSPQLDFLATTQAGGATVNIAITGEAADPQFTFTSSPDLPQDEILSRLLFGTPAGQLSTTQALSLATAVAQYSTGDGNDALEGLRRSLGLGDASRSGNPLSNLLGDRVSIGVRTGATPAENGVGVDVSLYKQFKVKGLLDATGNTSVGIGAEHEW